MGGELENAAFLIGRVEFAPEDVEHRFRRRVRAQRLEPVHHEIDGVVAHPFHRQLDNAGRRALELQLVTVLVGHQRGIVEQAHLLLDAQRVRAEVPGRCAQAHRPDAGDLFERLGRAQHQVAFGVVGQHRIQLVDPAVNADLMTFRHHTALLVLVQQGCDRRHVEGRRHAVALQDLQDARHADTRAILAPGHAADGLAAVAQLVGLVVGIKRQGEGAARAAGPLRRAIAAAGAHLADQLAPMRLRPLPGFHGGFGWIAHLKHLLVLGEWRVANSEWRMANGE